MAEMEWPDNDDIPTASSINHHTRADIREKVVAKKLRCRTPEYTGNKLLQTGDLEEHLLAISSQLASFDDITPIQRSKYTFASLGYQLSSLFSFPPSFTEIVETLTPVVLEDIQKPDLPIPWFSGLIRYIEIAELRQTSDESLLAFISRIYDCLNYCLMSSQIVQNTKNYIELVLVGALVNGLALEERNYMLFILKKWTRFPQTRPKDLNLFQACIDIMLQYHDLKISSEKSTFLVPIAKICAVQGSCTKPDCPFDHHIILSWSLNLATLIQKDDEELMAFTFRVKEILETTKHINKKDAHECMEILCVISMLNGCHDEHCKLLKERFLAWINHPKSHGSAFDACHDIFLQFDSELFSKNRVLSKKKIKKVKKSVLNRRWDHDSYDLGKLDQLVATHQPAQNFKPKGPIVLGKHKPILPVAPPRKSIVQKTKNGAFINVPHDYQEINKVDNRLLYNNNFHSASLPESYGRNMPQTNDKDITRCTEGNHCRREKCFDHDRDIRSSDSAPLRNIVECSYGAGCVRLDCPDLHEQMISERLKIVTHSRFRNQLCSFGMNCRRRDCAFEHNQIRDSKDRNTFRKKVKISCRNGVKCTRPDCIFEH